MPIIVIHMELAFAIIVVLWLFALSYPYLRSFLAKKQAPREVGANIVLPAWDKPIKPFVADDKHSWDVEQAQKDNRD